MGDVNDDMLSGDKPATKVALVAIVGRPSVGKSTFLNNAIGHPVSIVSATPQTTRNSIRGILNRRVGQIVFIDTPGLHDSDKKLNLALKGVALNALRDSDAVLYILDGTRPPREEESMTQDILRGYMDKTVVVVNKLDSPNAKIEDTVAYIRTSMPSIPQGRILSMSARTGEGIKGVVDELFSLAHEGELLYPREYYTDQEVDFRIKEIIRGKAIERLSEELPHAIYVGIEDMEFKGNETTLWVRAVIYVERESQKSIVIGKKASMVRSIREASLKECNKIFPYRIALDLMVKVDKNWRQKDTTLNKLLS